MDPDKPILPNNWIVCHSLSYPDRIYYFNTNTGVTTWECPPMIANAGSVAQINGAIHETHDSSFQYDGKYVNRVISTPSVEEEPISINRKILDNSSYLQNGYSPSNYNPFKRLKLEDNRSDVMVPVTLDCVTNVTETHFSSPTCSQSERIVSFDEVGKQVSIQINSARRNSTVPQAISFRTGENCNYSSDNYSNSPTINKSSSIQIHKSPSKNKLPLHIVLDTNILMHELLFLNQVKDIQFASGFPHFIIPWIVTQELDNIKNKPYDIIGLETHKLAEEATKFLFQLFSSNHPRFHGQPSDKNKSVIETKCNDEKILDCCLYLASDMPIDRVILLSNDHGLCNKALINGIRALTAESFQRTASNLDGVQHQTVKCLNFPVVERRKLPDMTTLLESVFNCMQNYCAVLYDSIDLSHEFKINVDERDNFPNAEECHALISHFYFLLRNMKTIGYLFKKGKAQESDFMLFYKHLADFIKAVKADFNLNFSEINAVMLERFCSNSDNKPFFENTCEKLDSLYWALFEYVMRHADKAAGKKP